MSDKLNTQTVMSTGNIVHISFNTPNDEPGLFRVIYADTVGICVVDMQAEDVVEYDRAPVFCENKIKGSYFYPWHSVDSLNLVMDSNQYVITYGGSR